MSEADASIDARLRSAAANRASAAGAYSWYVLALLFLVYVTNHVDRQILMILLEPIKQEFGASDFQMGLLTGPAFALFYTVAGIPIARWADRGSRRMIVAVSAAIWSGMTALSGTARSFLTLAMLRVGVGIGEAGCSPPAHSLISDYFPLEQRARAMAIYAAGTLAGGAVGWLLGGWLYRYLGWRWAFVAVGLPGLLLALLVVTTIREPRRGAVESGDVDSRPMPLAEAFRSLLARRSYVWLQAGTALHGVAAYGLVVWTAPFLIRVHGLEIHVIGTWLGLISLLVGVPGMLLGGYICDRLAWRDPRWYLRIPVLSAVLSIPFTTLFLFLPDPTWALLAFVGHTLLVQSHAAPVYAMIQAVVKVRTRSIAVAIQLFVVNLFGLGLGPVIVGGLNDALRADFGDGAIRYTMLLAAFTNVIACAFYFLAGRTVREDIARNTDGFGGSG